MALANQRGYIWQCKPICTLHSLIRAAFWVFHSDHYRYADTEQARADYQRYLDGLAIIAGVLDQIRGTVMSNPEDEVYNAAQRMSQAAVDALGGAGVAGPYSIRVIADGLDHEGADWWIHIEAGTSEYVVQIDATETEANVYPKDGKAHLPAK